MYGMYLFIDLCMYVCRIVCIDKSMHVFKVIKIF